MFKKGNAHLFDRARGAFPDRNAAAAASSCNLKRVSSSGVSVQNLRLYHRLNCENKRKIKNTDAHQDVRLKTHAPGDRNRPQRPCKTRPLHARNRQVSRSLSKLVNCTSCQGVRPDLQPSARTKRQDVGVKVGRERRLQAPVGGGALGGLAENGCGGFTCFARHDFCKFGPQEDLFFWFLFRGGSGSVGAFWTWGTLSSCESWALVNSCSFYSDFYF